MQLLKTQHLRLTRLPSIALSTDDFFDSKSVDLVMIVLGHLWPHCRETTRHGSTTSKASPSQYLYFGRQDGTLIMADTAPKCSSTTRSNHGAVAIVMRTRRSTLFVTLCLLVAPRLDENALLRQRISCSLLVPVTHICIGKFRCTLTIITAFGGINSARETGTSTIHEMLDRASFCHWTFRVVCHDGLYACSTLFFSELCHGSTPCWWTIMVFVAVVYRYVWLIWLVGWFVIHTGLMRFVAVVYVRLIWFNTSA